jgi:hypothetical protein
MKDEESQIQRVLQGDRCMMQVLLTGDDDDVLDWPQTLMPYVAVRKSTRRYVPYEFQPGRLVLVLAGLVALYREDERIALDEHRDKLVPIDVYGPGAVIPFWHLYDESGTALLRTVSPQVEVVEVPQVDLHAVLGTQRTYALSLMQMQLRQMIVRFAGCDDTIPNMLRVEFVLGEYVRRLGSSFCCLPTNIVAQLSRMSYKVFSRKDTWQIKLLQKAKASLHCKQ